MTRSIVSFVAALVIAAAVTWAMVGVGVEQTWAIVDGWIAFIIAGVSFQRLSHG